MRFPKSSNWMIFELLITLPKLSLFRRLKFVLTYINHFQHTETKNGVIIWFLHRFMTCERSTKKSKKRIIEFNGWLCRTFLPLEHEQKINEHIEISTHTKFTVVARQFGAFVVSRLLILTLYFIPPARISNPFSGECRFSNKLVQLHYRP